MSPIYIKSLTLGVMKLISTDRSAPSTKGRIMITCQGPEVASSQPEMVNSSWKSKYICTVNADPRVRYRQITPPEITLRLPKYFCVVELGTTCLRSLGFGLCDIMTTAMPVAVVCIGMAGTSRHAHALR